MNYCTSGTSLPSNQPLFGFEYRKTPLPKLIVKRFKIFCLEIVPSPQRLSEVLLPLSRSSGALRSWPRVDPLKQFQQRFQSICQSRQIHWACVARIAASTGRAAFATNRDQLVVE